MLLREVLKPDNTDEGFKTKSGRMYCCGVAELYAVLATPLEKIKDALYMARHQIRVGMVIATTGQGSTAAITRKNLKEAGFKELMTGHNPRMGGDVTVWGCDVNGIKQDPEKDNKFIGTSAEKGGAENVLGNVFIP